MCSNKQDRESSDFSYPSARQLCREFNLQAKKHWGQNFLDRGLSIQKMLSPFNLSTDSCVLEIGPGLGHLSQAILARGARLLALEIDKDLGPVLGALEERYSNFQVLYGPAQAWDWGQLLSSCKGDSYVFGNLPYYLSSELYAKALLEVGEARGMSFLLQREVAERFAHAPASKLYGPLSVLGQSYGRVSLGERIKAAAFYPPPTIESRVLRLEKWPSPLLASSSLPAYWAYLQAAFQNRRKTLMNNLARLGQEEGWESADLSYIWKNAKIEPATRAEELSPSQHVEIFEALESVNPSWGYEV
ncbi:MAG: 16S rRNA (adenine(1518)-N(6)/adenine(1519)-N(6))-dimethyltransferase RsmA [Eubacteriales bacterium]|nr:16S rRNA (adenine(1518)-N(6)/adenine(1519)-N(6))-dimethyltransferase RsmA [Eubacteriales bacterium]